MNFIKELTNYFSKDIVITDKASMQVFECDGLSAYKQIPTVVVVPEHISQIKKVLEIANKYSVPVVTRGAGTGLSGGAMPIKGSILLVLSKLNKILKIDIENKVAIVEPGVRNLAISEAISEFNLYYAPDPSSQIACSIGGNVAENSGGVHCLKYGLTVNNVVAIQIITIDGEEIELNINDTGVNILALLNGSEGLLGIITQITVKLLEKPAKSVVVMAEYDDVIECSNAVGEIIKAGIIPAGLEMMDRFAIQAAESFVQVGYPLNEALLLCELDGSEEQVAQELIIVKKVLNNAKSLVISKDEQHRINLWKGRKSAFPAIGRLSPDYYCMDGTIPRSKLGEVLQKIQELSIKYNLKVANVFHAGDGNLHPLILYDANKGELEKTEKFGNEILKLCVEVGGNITGEHGVGIEKLDAMCYQFPQAELEIFYGIKDVFDKNKLLNPGKAVPTLHRCAELGKMHIHNGEMPHPNLERF